MTHTVPVFEGFSMPNAIRRIDVAGRSTFFLCSVFCCEIPRACLPKQNKKQKNRDVTDYLQLLLRKSGYRFTTTAEKEIVRTLKEKVCVVSQDLRKDLRDSSKPVDFTLPDGNIIKVSQLFLMVLLHLFVCFLTFLLFCPDW